MRENGYIGSSSGVDGYIGSFTSERNFGFTFSNLDKGVSIVAIALADSAREFMKTYVHEIGHVKSHIAQACNINPYGEEIQYLGDDIVGATWDVAEELLCYRYGTKR